jgi:hypothetical protein
MTNTFTTPDGTGTFLSAAVPCTGWTSLSSTGAPLSAADLAAIRVLIGQINNTATDYAFTVAPDGWVYFSYASASGTSLLLRGQFSLGQSIVQVCEGLSGAVPPPVTPPAAPATVLPPATPVLSPVQTVNLANAGNAAATAGAPAPMSVLMPVQAPGVPTWGWVVMGLAAAGLIGGAIWAFSNSGGPQANPLGEAVAAPSPRRRRRRRRK